MVRGFWVELPFVNYLDISYITGMKEQILPAKMLKEMSDRFPDAWKEADNLRSDQGKDLPKWTGQVFMPMAGWLVVACKAGKSIVPDPGMIQQAQLMQPLGAWRPAQDIVRFDPDVLQGIADTPLDGKLPADVFWRMPAWAIYFDVPLDVDGIAYHGFFAVLEEDMNDWSRELRLFFVADGKETRPVIIHLGDWDLETALAKSDLVAVMQAAQMGIDMENLLQTKPNPGIVGALNLLLYVCAYGLDGKERQPGASVTYPQARKVKKGWRLYPPDAPNIHVLGEDMGKQIRESRGKAAGHPGSNAAKSPHIRRAHWHSFWTGSKKEGGERKILVRWLPPMAIAMGEDGEEG